MNAKNFKSGFGKYLIEAVLKDGGKSNELSGNKINLEFLNLFFELYAILAAI